MLLLVTIDTETPQTPMARGQIADCLMDLSCDGASVGASFILDELDRLELKGVFFVNVYESGVWGASYIAELCEKIHCTGHELALHTHPAWMFDASRPNMWQYSPDEQISILKKGQRLLSDWLPGFRVVSHRAGAYGLNQGTIIALERVGIPVDSSMFYRHRNCQVTWTRNQPSKKQGILEVPVTGFHRVSNYTVAGFPIVRRSRFIKTDINWSSADEIATFVRYGEKYGIKVVNLFLHSYSFVSFNKDYSRFIPRIDRMEKFREFIAKLKIEWDLKNVTLRDIYELHREDSSFLSYNTDLVPVVTHEKALAKVLLRRAKKRFFT